LADLMNLVDVEGVLASVLIAEEAGVVNRTAKGQSLNFPVSIESS
jgi:hypothetical protein